MLMTFHLLPPALPFTTYLFAICSTNIITAGNFHLFPQRLFTVGRLDKESTGLILVTSDGRVNQALLGAKRGQSTLEATEGDANANNENDPDGGYADRKEKVYVVETHPRAPTDAQLAQLRDGIVITTENQRDNNNVRGVTKQVGLPCLLLSNYTSW